MTTITALRDAGTDQLDKAIDTLTSEEWRVLEEGYLDLICTDLCRTLVNPLGLCEGVDAGDLFCRLYQRFLTRTSEV